MTVWILILALYAQGAGGHDVPPTVNAVFTREDDCLREGSTWQKLVRAAGDYSTEVSFQCERRRVQEHASSEGA